MGTKGKEKWRACMLETETTMPLSVGLMFTKRVITPLVVSKVCSVSKFFTESVLLLISPFDFLASLTLPFWMHQAGSRTLLEI